MANRTCHKSFDAVYSQSNLAMEFKIIKGLPARSTLVEAERTFEETSHVVGREFKVINVNTISLTDLLDSFNSPKNIQFISIDTEGSEFEILNTFDFNKYVFNSICVEFGSEETRDKIFQLLSKHGYQRKWEDISEHDDWYVHESRIGIKYPAISDQDLQPMLVKEHAIMARAKNRNTRKLRQAIKIEMDKLIPSKSKGLQYRMDLSLKCDDCAYIPKVANAGDTMVEDGKKIQIMHNGVKVLASGYIGPWMTKLITELKGHHEPQEEVVFHEVLKLIKKDAPVMIELGCYWAYYTCWFKSVFPKGRGICAEPHAKNLNIGKSNIALNKFDNVEFHHAFAGKYDRVKNLLKNDEKNVFSKEFLSVQDLINIHSLEHIDVLHLDIQGAETDVMEEALDILSKGMVTFLIVSTHVHYISGDPLTHQKCLQYAKDCGGRILVEHEVHESFSGDGLIAVCFDDSIELPELHISYCRYSESFYRNPLYDVRY